MGIRVGAVAREVGMAPQGEGEDTVWMVGPQLLLGSFNYPLGGDGRLAGDVV